MLPVLHVSWLKYMGFPPGQGVLQRGDRISVRWDLGHLMPVSLILPLLPMGEKDEILWHFTQQVLHTKTDAVYRVGGNYSHLCLARVMKDWREKKKKKKES